MKILLNKHIESLILINEFDDALTLLKKELPDYLDEIIVIQSRYNHYEEKNIKDLVEFAKIRAAVLDLNKNVSNDSKIELKGTEQAKISIKKILFRYGLWMIFGWWSMILIGGVYSDWKLKKGIIVESEITASTIDFILKEKSNFIFEKAFNKIQLNGFHNIKIPASKIQYTNGEDEIFQDSFSNGQFEILKGEVDQHILMSAKNLELEKLELEKGAHVKLNFSNDKIISFHIQPGTLTGKIIASDSLNFDVENVSIGTHQIDNAYGYASSQSSSMDIELKGEKELFSMVLLGNSEEWDFLEEKKQQSIYIQNIGFEVIVDGVKKSTIEERGKTFIISEKNNKPYLDIDIPVNSYWKEKGEANFIIKSIKKQDGKFLIKFIGNAEYINVGHDKDNLKPINPSLLQWSWYNRKTEFLIFLSMSLLLSIGLWHYLRNKQFVKS